MSAWTNVPKPTESSTLTLSGSAEPIGFLIALTSVTSGPVVSIISGWTDIAKPTTATWVNVPKSVSSTWTVIAKPTT